MLPERNHSYALGMPQSLDNNVATRQTRFPYNSDVHRVGGPPYFTDVCGFKKIEAMDTPIDCHSKGPKTVCYFHSILEEQSYRTYATIFQRPSGYIRES